MSIELTKDSDALICLMYKSYLEKRKDGTSKALAKKFGYDADLHAALCPKATLDDTTETCMELIRAGLITGNPTLDRTINNITIADKGIIYMENRFKDGFSDVCEYLGKIKGAIPFL